MLTIFRVETFADRKFRGDKLSRMPKVKATIREYKLSQVATKKYIAGRKFTAYKINNMKLPFNLKDNHLYLFTWPIYSWRR